MGTIDELLEHNAGYAKAFRSGDLPAAPGRRVAVVVCMDARISVPEVLGLAPGDAHVIRNAGGLVTDDVIRSLTLSQRLLGTREVMLIQHTGCGLLGIDEERVARQLREETGQDPPFRVGSIEELDVSLRASVAKIRESPFVPHKDDVRGFVYEVETGRLREVA